MSLDDGAENPEEPKQQEPFEPKLPEEYADLSLDADEEPAGDDEAQRPRLAPGIKVLLYVCCVLAASVLLAVVGWRLADDVLALTKPDEEITITVPENATVADVSRELKEKGLIEYEWLFRFYCLYSHAERKIQPGTYELNHLYDYHALVNGMTPSTGLRATTEVTIPEGYECEDIFALLEEAGVSTVSELEQAAARYEFDYSFLQDLPYGDKNRLYPCLQIDATIQYALDERKEVLSNADKAIISPYNTYTNAGLPAGPIANPGINSIRAALYPADTDYYFYALGSDGVHKFSKTYYEHQDFLASLEGDSASDAAPDEQADAETGDASADADANGEASTDGGDANGT